MGIYIKSMEMPNSCLFCPLNSMKQCRITGGDITWATATQNIRGDCPLVPVPPHGRLGDLDALHKLFLEKGKEYKGVGGAMVAAAAWCIANAPTIIPAEEVDEDG